MKIDIFHFSFCHSKLEYILIIIIKIMHLQSRCLKPNNNLIESAFKQTNDEFQYFHRKVSPLSSIRQNRLSLQNKNSQSPKIQTFKINDQNSKDVLSSRIQKYMLSSVKQTFKRICRQKNKASKEKEQLFRNNGESISQLSKNLQNSVSIIKKNISKQMTPNFKNKKLINLKKGRLFKTTERKDLSQKLIKRIQSQKIMEEDNKYVSEQSEFQISPQELQEDYLTSQHFQSRRRQSNLKNLQHIKTEERTIQPHNHNLNKYQSQMLQRHRKKGSSNIKSVNKEERSRSVGTRKYTYKDRRQQHQSLSRNRFQKIESNIFDPFQKNEHSKDELAMSRKSTNRWKQSFKYNRKNIDPLFSMLFRNA